MKVDDNPFPGDQNMVNAAQPMHFLRSTFCYASYALQGIGHVANFVMHSLKQVYIYVISIVWIKFEIFVLIWNSENPDFQYLNPTLKTHFKIEAHFGVESKIKIVELVELYKVCFWSFSSCLVKFEVIWKGEIP